MIIIPGPNVYFQAPQGGYVLKNSNLVDNDAYTDAWNTAGREYAAIAFKPTTNYTLNRIKIKLQKLGSPTQTMTCAIRSDSSGPSTVITNGTSDTTLSMSTFTSAPGAFETWDFSNGPSLIADTLYYVTLQISATSGTDWAGIRVDETGGAGASPGYTYYGDGNVTWMVLFNRNPVFEAYTIG
jgi:hypothetical protein